MYKLLIKKINICKSGHVWAERYSAWWLYISSFCTWFSSWYPTWGRGGRSSQLGLPWLRSLYRKNPRVQLYRKNPRVQLYRKNPRVQLYRKTPRVQLYRKNPRVQLYRKIHVYNCIGKIHVFNCIGKIHRFNCIGKLPVFNCIGKILVYNCIGKSTCSLFNCKGKIHVFNCLSSRTRVFGLKAAKTLVFSVYSGFKLSPFFGSGINSFALSLSVSSGPTYWTYRRIYYVRSMCLLYTYISLFWKRKSHCSIYSRCVVYSHFVQSNKHIHKPFTTPPPPHDGFFVHTKNYTCTSYI